MSKRNGRSADRNRTIARVRTAFARGRLAEASLAIIESILRNPRKFQKLLKWRRLIPQGHAGLTRGISIPSVLLYTVGLEATQPIMARWKPYGKRRLILELREEET